MIDFFPLDVIADEIANHLRAGQPSKRLMRRFFKAGRRNGKVGQDPLTVALLIREAVNLASTTLCLEYVDRRTAVFQALARLSAADAVDQTPFSSANSPWELGQEPLEAVTPPLSSTTVHSSDGDAELREALVRRRALAARRRARKINIDVERRAHATTAAREQAVRVRAEACQRQAELIASTHELRAQYLEQFNAIAYGGSLLWARYCTGFEEGYSVRRSRGSAVRPPRDALVFDIPPVLADLGWPLTAASAVDLASEESNDAPL